MVCSKRNDWYIQILQLFTRLSCSSKFTIVPRSTLNVWKLMPSLGRELISVWITESCSQSISLAPGRGQLDSSSTRSGCIWWRRLARKTMKWEREERWDRVNKLSGAHRQLLEYSELWLLRSATCVIMFFKLKPFARIQYSMKMVQEVFTEWSVRCINLYLASILRRHMFRWVS